MANNRSWQKDRVTNHLFSHFFYSSVTPTHHFYPHRHDSLKSSHTQGIFPLSIFLTPGGHDVDRLLSGLASVLAEDASWGGGMTPGKRNENELNKCCNHYVIAPTNPSLRFSRMTYHASCSVSRPSKPLLAPCSHVLSMDILMWIFAFLLYLSSLMDPFARQPLCLYVTIYNSMHCVVLTFQHNFTLLLITTMGRRRLRSVLKIRDFIAPMNLEGRKPSFSHPDSAKSRIKHLRVCRGDIVSKGIIPIF